MELTFSDDKPLTARRLATMLGDYGIKPKPLAGWNDEHTDGTRGYERKWFEDAWQRYTTDPAATPPDDASEAQDPQESHGHGVSGDSEHASQSDALHIEKPPKPLGQAILAGLADQNGHKAGNRAEKRVQRQYLTPAEPCIHCGAVTQLAVNYKPVCDDCYANTHEVSS